MFAGCGAAATADCAAAATAVCGASKEKEGESQVEERVTGVDVEALESQADAAECAVGGGGGGGPAGN